MLDSRYSPGRKQGLRVMMNEQFVILPNIPAAKIPFGFSKATAPHAGVLIIINTETGKIFIEVQSPRIIFFEIYIFGLAAYR